MGPSGLKEDCQNNSLWKVPTPSSLLTSAILWQPKKATWLNLQAISITDSQQRLCCCLYGWLSVSCGEFVASSRWHLLLAEAQPFEEKGREKKKIPIRMLAHAVLCLLAWVFCWRIGTSAQKGERRRLELALAGAEVPPALGGFEGVQRAGGGQQQEQDRTTRGVHRLD